MRTPTRCDCGDTECRSCGTAQGTRSPCAAPTFPAFDIDVYDCPCGHPYGGHDYGRYANGDMRINFCVDCREESRSGTEESP